ncbi:MAG: hypothetical protein ABJH52_09760 [Henriciella sp.]
MSANISFFISRLGAILLLFFMAACDAPDSGSAQKLASIDTPLGFSWENFTHEGKQFGPHPIVQCQKHVDELSSVIPSRVSIEFVEQCLQQKYREVHLEPEAIPPILSDGEITVTVKGRSEPVVFNYSYLHRLLVDPEYGANSKKRHARARELKADLVSMYGPAQSSGFFDQFGWGGFAPQEGGERSCDLWVEQDVGIVLCAERIVLIDGIEMSLTYIKLNRVPFGDYLRCVATGHELSRCTTELENSPDEHPDEDTDYLDVLSDWLASTKFKLCAASNLSSLETAWALTPEIEVQAERIVGEFREEALAEYVFESGLESNQLVMYLLRTAADQGSASAMNEIGASLLYCYQDIEQDLVQAAEWLQSATDLGDPYAMRSLALMHMKGMMETSDSLTAAANLLAECNKIDEMECSREFRAIEELVAELNAKVSPR